MRNFNLSVLSKLKDLRLLDNSRDWTASGPLVPGESELEMPPKNPEFRMVNQAGEEVPDPKVTFNAWYQRQMVMYWIVIGQRQLLCDFTRSADNRPHAPADKQSDYPGVLFLHTGVDPVGFTSLTGRRLTAFVNPELQPPTEPPLPFTRISEMRPEATPQMPALVVPGLAAPSQLVEKRPFVEGLPGLFGMYGLPLPRRPRCRAFSCVRLKEVSTPMGDSNT